MKLLERYNSWKQTWHLPLATYHFDGTTEHHCANCGWHYEGNFCPCCGQSSQVERFTWKSLPKGFLEIWDLSTRSIPSTFWQLIYRPGFLIGDYLRGRRQSYYPPIKLLVIVALITTVAEHFFFHEVVEQERTEMEGNWKENREGLKEITEMTEAEEGEVQAVLSTDKDLRTAMTEAKEAAGKAAKAQASTPPTDKAAMDKATKKAKATASEAKAPKAKAEQAKVEQARAIAKAQDMTDIFDMASDWADSNRGWATLMGCCLFILPTWLLFRKAPRYPGITMPECFFMEAYICVITLTFDFLSNLIPGISLWNVFVFYFAYQQLFGYGRWVTFWRTSLVLLIGVSTLFLIIIAAIFIYVTTLII